MNRSGGGRLVVGDGKVLLVKQSGLGVVSGDRGGGGMNLSPAGAGEGGSMYGT